MYGLSTGQTVSFRYLRKNLKTIYVEPNSLVVRDLSDRGYGQKLLDEGYSTQMMPYNPSGPIQTLENKKKVEVSNRYSLYKSSLGGRYVSIGYIGNHLDEFYINDNPDLIAELLEYNFHDHMVKRGILPRFHFETPAGFFNASYIGQHFQEFEISREDETLIDALVHIGYKNKLVNLGIIPPEYDEDSEEDELQTNNQSDDNDNNPNADGNNPNDDGNNPNDDGNNPNDDGNNPNDDGNSPNDDGNNPNDDGNNPNDDGNNPNDDGGNANQSGSKRNKRKSRRSAAKSSASVPAGSVSGAPAPDGSSGDDSSDTGRKRPNDGKKPNAKPPSTPTPNP